VGRGQVVFGALGAMAIAAALAGCSDSSARGSPEFEAACLEGMQEASAWAVGEASRQGKDVGVFKRVAIDTKLRAACTCAAAELRSQVAADRMAFAGRLVGYRVKSGIVLKGKDRDLKERTRDSLRDELQDLMSEHNISLVDTGLLTRKVDETLKDCLRK